MQQLQLADGWDLVLAVWRQRPLDQHVICKLLCTSQAMASMVHAMFAGQLEAKMKSLCIMPSIENKDVVLEDTHAHSWLARNALLLKSFEFWPGGDPDEDGDESADDELVSEGFAKAAAAAAFPAADAAVAGSNCAEPPAAELPLQRLVCGVPSASRLLRSLAGVTPHLTSLCLCVADADTVNDIDFHACEGALAALTSLREVTLGCAGPPGAKYVPSCYNVHLQSLEHLTQLTALDLAPGRRGWPDEPNPWPEMCCLHTRELQPWAGRLFRLPPSIVDLALPFRDCQALVYLRHMTALTQLFVGGLCDVIHLPPRVQHLQLHDSRSLKPVLEGCAQHLRKLRLEFENTVCGLPAGFHQQLSQLNTLHMHVRMDGHLPGVCSDLVQGCAHLADLPSLHALVVHWESLPSLAVAAFASCTQLTRLSLRQDQLKDGSAVQELGPRLAHMHNLQQLHLSGLGRAEFSTLPVAWLQLCAAVAKLPAMREVELEKCCVSSAARKLAAATQLTRLVLVDCGMNAAAKASLAAGLDLPQQSSRSCTGRALVVI